PFAESRGNVLLVLKGNPKGITGIADLIADDVTLAISNPDTEKASFGIYRDTLVGLAGATGVDAKALEEMISREGAGTVFSSTIHHREIPELLADGRADVAVLYYHLALRYTRIFPETFEMIGLGGVPDGARSQANPTTRYHIGLINGGGRWGPRFEAFMLSGEARLLYERHGLQSPG
ncbi:MAG TPA: ABC transporter substrate-binding protein, partial [Rhodospirillales bacterium]|nr:ABC transporter substrate-binding protein [Rhodospirillales bacterium]